MLRLRHFLLVATLVLAQLLAGAHAVEHVLEDGKHGVAAGHSCLVCLSAQNLGSAVPSTPPALVLPDMVAVWVAQVHTGRSAWPAPQARQGAPPRC